VLGVRRIQHREECTHATLLASVLTAETLLLVAITLPDVMATVGTPRERKWARFASVPVKTTTS